jgi:hypothetical protein
LDLREALSKLGAVAALALSFVAGYGAAAQHRVIGYFMGPVIQSTSFRTVDRSALELRRGVQSVLLPNYSGERAHAKGNHG